MQQPESPTEKLAASGLSGAGEASGGRRRKGHTVHDHGEGASAMLLKAVEGEGEKISIGEIIDKLDARAFGLGVLMFALPSCLPMPPGVPTIVGVVLLIVSIQMVMFRSELWLPRLISDRSFARAPLVGGIRKVKPRLEALERFAKPRLLFLTGRLGTFLIGVIVLIMAIVLILPLPPGGNLPPALACAVLGMGLAERDGVIILLGLLASIAALVISYLVTLAGIDLVMGWFS